MEDLPSGLGDRGRYVAKTITGSSMNKSARFDKVVGFLVIAVLVYSTVLLIHAYYDGKNLATWVWDRHQNQFSWYSRPLFIVPACYYAYRQNLGLVIGFMAMLFCSLFWFRAPPDVPEHISNYLAWEKQLFFSNESMVPLMVLTIVVIAFLIGLFSAFWRQNPWIGLFLINAGTLVKIFVSIAIGKETGTAATVPSLSSLAVINLVAFVAWRLFRNKSEAEGAT